MGGEVMLGSPFLTAPLPVTSGPVMGSGLKGRLSCSSGGGGFSSSPPPCCAWDWQGHFQPALDFGLPPDVPPIGASSDTPLWGLQMLPPPKAS